MPAPARGVPRESNCIEGQIQRRAYGRYVERGNQSGLELDNWLQAEEDL